MFRLFSTLTRYPLIRLMGFSEISVGNLIQLGIESRELPWSGAQILRSLPVSHAIGGNPSVTWETWMWPRIPLTYVHVEESNQAIPRDLTLLLTMCPFDWEISMLRNLSYQSGHIVEEGLRSPVTIILFYLQYLSLIHSPTLRTLIRWQPNDSELSTWSSLKVGICMER